MIFVVKKDFYQQISRDLYENEMRAKEELESELARKDELLLTTVCEFEDKISELQEKNSINTSEIPETPRVSIERFLLILKS